MVHAVRRDPEERDLEILVEGLRRLLKDKPTEPALRRLAKAALGETLKDQGRSDDADGSA